MIKFVSDLRLVGGFLQVLRFHQWRIQGWALGASAPPRQKSQAHILTYTFQGYLTSRYGF